MPYLYALPFLSKCSSASFTDTFVKWNGIRSITYFIFFRVCDFFNFSIMSRSWTLGSWHDDYITIIRQQLTIIYMPSLAYTGDMLFFLCLGHKIIVIILFSFYLLLNHSFTNQSQRRRSSLLSDQFNLSSAPFHTRFTRLDAYEQHLFWFETRFIFYWIFHNTQFTNGGVCKGAWSYLLPNWIVLYFCLGNCVLNPAVKLTKSEEAINRGWFWLDYIYLVKIGVLCHSCNGENWKNWIMHQYNILFCMLLFFVTFKNF